MRLNQCLRQRAELRERQEHLRDLVLKPVNKPDMVGPSDPVSGVK